ncbi:diacylglycerol kinase [Microbacterium hibisci]|uniref:diacylglycerol kinase n=1 Tax=Microbacterium hibisci TaxID=2036000 RepID=UPI0019426FBA|nr:diacylglycerol kinase [Microbacterium hibisci]
MRVALLANPAARSGAHTGAAEKAAELLRAHGVQTTILSGGSAAESSELLRTAIGVGVDAVAVAGGDGTVGLAVQELAGTGIPLGIIPSGTGNDFAATLGLRELDIAAAATAIAGGEIRRVDLARVTREDGSTRYFGSVLASGFDSKVNDRANAMRWPRGGSRYNVAILVEFLTLAGIPYDVEYERADGTRERISGDLVMATVGNGRTYGGGIPIAPDADPADGLLDLVLVRPAGRLRLLGLLPKVYRGTHATVEQVSITRVRSVRLESPGVTAYADGDPIGALPLTVDVVPGALEVFTPAHPRADDRWGDDG